MMSFILFKSSFIFPDIEFDTPKDSHWMTQKSPNLHKGQGGFLNVFIPLVLLIRKWLSGREQLKNSQRNNSIIFPELRDAEQYLNLKTIVLNLSLKKNIHYSARRGWNANVRLWQSTFLESLSRRSTYHTLENNSLVLLKCRGKIFWL